MKKRIISLLILFGTILSLFPVTSIAAEEVLPKDETPGTQSETVAEENALTDYDKLYVGANGEKTANGGELIAFYTAMGEDVASVNLTAKTWSDKLGKAADATLIGDGWVTYAEGGFGYDYAYNDLKSKAGNYGLALPEELLLPDLYIETLAKVNSFREADGTLLSITKGTYNTSPSNYASFVRIDLLSSLFFIGIPRTGACESHGSRWMLTYLAAATIYHAGAWSKYKSSNEFVYTNAARANGLMPVAVTSQYERTTDADGTETYAVGYAIDSRYEMKITAAEKAALAADKTKTVDKAKSLSFFNGIPSDVYAIRVYSAPLTESERDQNAVADILAYVGADLTKYLSLNAETRAVINGILAKGGIIEDKAAVSAKLNETVKLYENQIRIEDTLYVQDGLIFFASAYKNLSTGYTEGSGNINWVNTIDPTQTATLQGGFFENEKGGFTVVKTVDEITGGKTDLTSNEFNALWNKQNKFGIYMPASALPAEDYTVELAYNPMGISVRDPDGELSRYFDDVTGTGVYNTTGIAIGPMRCLQFSCYRVASGGQMERRWYYSHNQDLSGLKWKYEFADNMWNSLEQDEVTVLSVTHDYKNRSSAYQFYNNAISFQTYDVGPEAYKTTKEASYNFRLMVGMAGTAYSIRVYDRALSADEVARNKLADLVYYYDLDASRVLDLIELLGSNAYIVYRAMESLDFSMNKEKAQQMLDEAISAIWVAYEGLGVTKAADKDGVRFYFTCHADAIAAITALGYVAEIGAIVNVGKNTAPIWEGEGYDYKIVAHDSYGGKNSPFYVDDDTFALTVRYENLDKSAALTNVLVRGYVKLTAPDGTVAVYYTVPMGEDYEPDSLFTAYEGVMDAQAVKSSVATYGRLRDIVEKCYERNIIYTQAGAAAGGNGSKETPYRSFAEGFAAVKTLLRTVGVPTRCILMLGDGEYGVYEMQTLTAADMPYKYATLEITSQSGKATITTTKNIDETFTEYADNIWMCQFDKENGSYPDFRYLYVDGKIADLSYSGGRYISDEVQYVSAYERDYDGPWGRAYDLYKSSTLNEDSESGYPAHRKDLIEAFESFKTPFLALMDVDRINRQGTLTPDSVPTIASPTEEFITIFDDYKMRRLALNEMMARWGTLTGTTTEKRNAFNAFTATKYTDSARYEEYSKAFIALRDEVKSTEGWGSWDRFVPLPKTNSIAEGKYYLNEAVVGDLHEEIAIGKERNKAAYDALKKKYDAATDAEKAEMEEELAKAAERAGEYSWVKYALEGYGPAMHLAGQWWHNIIHVAGIDYDDVVVDKNGDTHVAVYLEKEEYANYHVHKTYTMVGRYVCMKDALSYVDSEGEYYYDDAFGKLYYYSEDGVSGKKLARATQDYMFYFDDVNGVTLSELHITGVDDAYLSHNDGVNSLGGTGAVGEPITESVASFDRSAILLDDCYGLTVQNCVFDELGARAIYGRGVLANITVESCEFIRLGANAVQLGNGKAEVQWLPGRSTIENVTITDNYVYDVAREYYTCSAIWLNQGKDVAITHNTVEKCSYSAICVGLQFSTVSHTPGNNWYHNYNVEIAYNYLTGFMHELGDGGGIYVTGGNAPISDTSYFNFVHHNYILLSNTTGNGLGHMLVAIYFDGSSSNWKCSENVVVEQSYGAVNGENEGYDMQDEEVAKYVTALRKRYHGTTFIFFQHISTQESHNILADNNYILNVRATTPDAQLKEVYKTFVVADRNIVVTNTHYVNDIMRIPSGAEEIILSTGSYGHAGDPYILESNDY